MWSDGPGRARPGDRQRDRFEGEICAFGSTSGYRVVVGRWPVSPFGPLADVMVEEPGGRRALAPTGESAAYIAPPHVRRRASRPSRRCAGPTG